MKMIQRYSNVFKEDIQRNSKFQKRTWNDCVLSIYTALKIHTCRLDFKYL